MTRHLPTVSRSQAFFRWVMRHTSMPKSTDDNFDDGAHYPSLHAWYGIKLRIFNWAESQRWAAGRRLYKKHGMKVFDDRKPR